MIRKETNGAVWNALGSTMYGFNSFFMLALVSRIGSVEEAGAFGIAFTTAQLMYIVGLFGISHYQMTDYEKKFSFQEYGLVRGASCGLMMIVCLISVVAMAFSVQKVLLTVLLTLLMMLNVVGDLYQNLFFQNGRLDLSGSALFYRTFWPLLVFSAALFFLKSLVFAISLQILCNFLVTMYYVCWKAPNFLKNEAHNANTTERCKRLCVECIPLFFSLLLEYLLISASKFGIEFWLDDQAQGYYSMIFMPAQVINLCSQFLFKPMLNQYAVLLRTKQQAQFRKLLKKQVALVIAFTLVCCAGAAILGVPVLGLLYGKNLSAYRVALVIVIMGGGIYALCQLLYYIFVIQRWQKNISYIYLAAVLAAVPITYGMIQWLGVSGAALSFAAVHCLIALLYLGVFWKKRNEEAA